MAEQAQQPAVVHPSEHPTEHPSSLEPQDPNALSIDEIHAQLSDRGRVEWDLAVHKVLLARSQQRERFLMQTLDATQQQMLDAAARGKAPTGSPTSGVDG